MKSIFTIFSLLISTAAFAQQDPIKLGVSIKGPKGNQITIHYGGNGEHVCASEYSFDHMAVLARGRTVNEAKALAQNLCASTYGKGDAFFCKILGCEQDVLNTGIGLNAGVQINSDSISVRLVISTKSKYLCSSNYSFDGITYFAEAPTLLEGKIFAQNSCGQDHGGDAFFCGKAKCEVLPNSSVNTGDNKPNVDIKVDDVINIFKKKKKN